MNRISRRTGNIAHDCPLLPNQRYAIFSDGVAEFDGDEGRPFGILGLRKLLGKAEKLPSTIEARNLIERELLALQQKQEIPDDMTLLLVDTMDF